MFSFLMTESARARRDARNWLEVADKVWHYRRDQLTDAQARELQALSGELRQRLRRKDDAGRLKLGMEGLEAALRKVGGRVYPKTSLTENVEFFLAAAIIILGIRAFVVQPFKIPTNSMWPSYNGMTHEVFEKPADSPNAVFRLGRFLAFGAIHYEMKAPATGAVQVPFIVRNGRVFVPFSVAKDRKWLVLPTQVREYQFIVGGEPARVRVPLDFDFDKVVQEAFFKEKGDLAAAITSMARNGKARESYLSPAPGSGGSPERVILVEVGTASKPGAPVLAFDILTGDQLFVDRLSYNFVRPDVGQGFVFRTGNIPGLARQVTGSNGRVEYMPDDKYYVKRLVGLPGDTLEIREPVLFRNGSPITGAKAFERNARQEENYPGYRNAGMLSNGGTAKVPPDRFLALGDNSPNSLDGRMWEFVPEDDVIGRPLFIYYPLTRRWGPIR